MYRLREGSTSVVLAELLASQFLPHSLLFFLGMKATALVWEEGIHYFGDTGILHAFVQA